MKHDDYNNLDLRGFDLSKLDLDEIAIDDDLAPSPVGRWLFGVLLLGMSVAFVVLPRTSFYAANQVSWFSFVFSLGGIITGLLAGRFLWGLLDDMRERLRARGVLTGAQPAPTGPPSAARRWLTLVAGIGGATAIVYFSTSGQVGASGDLWFVSAVGAVLVGILFGRWLTAQAEVSRKRPVQRVVKAPPWLKWVTLTLLVAIGLFVALGADLFGAALGPEASAAVGGIGFMLGIAAAIWIARRFDEEDARLRAKKRSG